MVFSENDGVQKVILLGCREKQSLSGAIFLVNTFGQFLPAPLHFSSCTPRPQYYAKIKLSLLFFKNPKMHLNCIYFLHYGLWNPKTFWISNSGNISDPPIRNSKYASFKKTFWIHQSVTEICIPYSKIHNLKKKNVPDP